MLNLLVQRFSWFRYGLVLGVLGLGIQLNQAQNTPTARYDTVAEMLAARIPASANTRISALVTGRVTANDGGGGIFFYDSSSSAATNLGTIFKPNTSGGRWFREYSGPVNVVWFGADSSGVVDSSIALQNSVDVAQDQSKSIFVPAGNFSFSTGITVASPISIEGVNPWGVIGNSVLDYTGNGTAITITSPRVSLRNISVNGDSAQYLIDHRGQYQLLYDTVRTSGAIVAHYYCSSYWVTWRQCWFDFNASTTTKGILNLQNFNANNVVECNFFMNNTWTGTAISVSESGSASAGSNIKNNNFEGGSGTSIRLNSICVGFTVEGNRQESYNDFISTGTSVESVRILNNTITSYTSNPKISKAISVSGKAFVIEGNYFSYATNGIVLESGSRDTFVNNNWPESTTVDNVYTNLGSVSNTTYGRLGGDFNVGDVFRAYPAGASNYWLASVGINTKTPQSRFDVRSQISAADFDWSATIGVGSPVGALIVSTNTNSVLRLATFNSNVDNDPFVSFTTITANNFQVGVDNSNGDIFKISNNASNLLSDNDDLLWLEPATAFATIGPKLTFGTYGNFSAGGPVMRTVSGIPASPDPNGSLALRTDGTGPNLYNRVNGAWVAVTTSGSIPIDIGAACSDELTPLVVGTNKVVFRTPGAFTLTGVRASLTTAQSSGSIFTVDINQNGTSVLSTKLTIDNTETTSTTAATPPVISTSSITDDAQITVDVDQIGDGTATGLKIWLIGTR